MGFMKQQIHEQLHILEEDIIQVRGLLSALQSLDCDDEPSIALLNAIDERFQNLEQNFYRLWEMSADE